MGLRLKRMFTKEYFTIYGLSLVAIAAAFYVAVQFIKPAPPSHISIAAGGRDGSYYRYAQAYAEYFAKKGITVTVLETKGSVENVELLTSEEEDGPVAGLVQGGAVSTVGIDSLEALGSMYYEPLWVFYREGFEMETLSSLEGKRAAVGPEGSGTRPLAMEVLQQNGVYTANSELLPLGGDDAITALRAGEVDAVFTVGGLTSKTVRQLLASKSTKLYSFDRADAYVRFYHYLSEVTLPKGSISLALDIPAQDTTLLAPTANLVVREDIHPALVDLFLLASAEIFKGGNQLEDPEQFPNPETTIFPVSDTAKRFYKSGPPLLMKYLPFWLATMVSRMVVLLIPLITIMYPLLKVAPPTFRWQVRRKIYKWYNELRDMDQASETLENHEQAMALNERLKELDSRVRAITVPLSYMEYQYTLRAHIRLIRLNIQEEFGPCETAATPPASGTGTTGA